MINQDILLEKVNQVMGADYTHKSFLETINDLVDKLERQEKEFITLSQSTAEDDTMISQLQNGIKLYQQQETILLERLKKAEQHTRFHKYMEMAQENLALAKEVARLKGEIHEQSENRHQLSEV